MGLDRSRRAAHASAAGLAQRLLQLLSTLVTLPLALHALGLTDFGVWGAATSLVGMAGILDIGLGAALVTLLPQVLASGNRGQARDRVSAALWAGCALAFVIFIVCGGLSVISTPPGPLRRSFLIASLCLALNSPLSIANNVWLGLQRGSVAAAWDLCQTLLTVLLLVAVVKLQGGVSLAVSAVYGALVLSSAGSMAHLWVSHPELRPRASYPRVRELRAVVGPGGLLFGVSLAVASSYVFDTVLALHWLGADAAAQTTVVLRVCTTAVGLIGIVTQPLWPAFGEAVVHGDVSWVRNALIWGVIGTVGAALVGGTVLTLLGAAAIRIWFRTDLVLHAPVFQVMAAWIVVWSAARVPGLFLNAASVLRPQLVAFGLAAGLGFALKIVLSRVYGISGMLVSTPISWALLVLPVYAWLIKRWLCAVPQARPT